VEDNDYIIVKGKTADAVSSGVTALHKVQHAECAADGCTRQIALKTDRHKASSSDFCWSCTPKSGRSGAGTPTKAKRAAAMKPNKHAAARARSFRSIDAMRTPELGYLIPPAPSSTAMPDLALDADEKPSTQPDASSESSALSFEESSDET
jgi:hypothetical protein